MLNETNGWTTTFTVLSAKREFGVVIPAYFTADTDDCIGYNKQVDTETDAQGNRTVTVKFSDMDKAFVTTVHWICPWEEIPAQYR